MGLDQYLKANVYVGAKYRRVKQNVLEVTKTLYNENEIVHFDDCKEYPTHNIGYIIYDIGYWRKCNWVHKWFVDNVQSGKDDCEEYTVSEQKLDELNKVCEQILNASNDYEFGKKGAKKTLLKTIDELLPPREGFFFGAVDMQDDRNLEYYIQSIVETRGFIELAKNYIKEFDAVIYYQSSW